MSAKALRLTLFALFLFLFAAVGAAIWLARGFALAIVHPPHVPLSRSPDDEGISVWRAVEFNTVGGLLLKGWYMPPAQPAPSVILVHGHGANRLNMLSRAATYVERGYGVLLFDLRAHGESEGDTSTLGYFERDDVIAAYTWLQAQPEIDPTRIVLHGESMGGAATIRAAAMLPDVRGVVIESTFATLEDNIHDGVRVSTGLPSFPFAPIILYFGEQAADARITDLRPIDQIGQIAPRPLLLMHGEQDPLLDVQNAHRLYAAAGEPKTLVLFPTGLHVGLIENDRALWVGAVDAFLERVFGV